MRLKKNRKLKGSVMLTVISVMALLIVFMTAAVTLSNSMNNRAHANYSDNQAEYTAKAAIQSFTQALEDNAAVAQTVVSMDIGDVVTPSVIVSDQGMGNVGYYKDGVWQRDKIMIEYVRDNMAYDPAQNAWVPMQVIKITATGKVGKQEKSVSYFIERAAIESKSSSIKGFQTLGGGGHQNNGEVTGALTMGLGQNGKYDYGFKNDYTLRTDTVFVNGHFTKTDGNSVVFNVVKPNTQYVIMGDFTVRGATFDINLDYPYGSSDAQGKISSENMTQQSIPYLYVKGNLGSASGNTKLNVNAVGVNSVHELKENAPFNIFAGTIGADTSATIPGLTDEGGNPVPRLGQASSGSWGGVELHGADLYLMNALDDTEVGHDSYLNPARESSLYKWSSSVLNGTSSKFYSEGGSIYCNHNLHIGQPLDVAGNLVVQGNLYLGAKVNVTGDLVVNGTIDNTDNIGTVGGKIYYNGTITTEVFSVKNRAADTALKAGAKRVENVVSGNIYVANKVVPNIPVYGDIVTEENTILEGYEEITLTCSNTTNWNWVDDNGDATIVQQLGFRDGNDFGNNGYNKWINDAETKPHLKKTDNFDGAGGRMITIMIKRDGDNIVDYKPAPMYMTRTGEETYDAFSVYYVTTGESGENDGEGETLIYELADPNDLHTELYVADKNGNPTEETTYDLTTTYRVTYNGEVTDEITTEEGTYYVPDSNGNATSNIATKFVYFFKVDPATGDPTDDQADGIYSYYMYDADTDKYTEITEDEAYTEESGLYRAWYDETVLVPDEYYYYKADPTGHSGEDWHNANLASEDDITSGAYYLVTAYSGYHDGSVYPSAMTDDNITKGDQKIVMSLKEARANIGMSADGSFPDGMYNTNFDSTTVGYKEEANTFTDPDTNSGTDYVITKSGTITGNWQHKAIRIKPKDASDVINIVLKDCSFSNGASIVVDNKGLVNILLEGNVVFSASDSGIYTDYVYKKWKDDEQIRINETDKLNIIMYGKEGSKLSVENTAVVCAIAKCPYTSFQNPATQGLTGKWKYVMKTGQIWEPKTVNWIGSALFGDSTTNDNFALLYTNAADGGDSISNDGVEGANWYGKYYDAY